YMMPADQGEDAKLKAISERLMQRYNLRVADFDALKKDRNMVRKLPVIINALFVGAQVAIFTDDAGFFATFLYVALGQAVVVYGLGLPLSHIIKKTKIF
ncbi:MAG: QueT transporter family protein, partial [Clostridia bacterium]|nr:QueT transporter family protein [Clostridia bacterium]